MAERLRMPLNPRVKISKTGRPYVETADLVKSVLERMNAMNTETNNPNETPLAVRHCGDPYKACCLSYKTNVFPDGWCNCNCGDCRVAKYVAAEQANQERGIAK